MKISTKNPWSRFYSTFPILLFFCLVPGRVLSTMNEHSSLWIDVCATRRYWGNFKCTFLDQSIFSWELGYLLEPIKAENLLDYSEMKENIRKSFKRVFQNIIMSKTFLHVFFDKMSLIYKLLELIRTFFVIMSYSSLIPSIPHIEFSPQKFVA